MENKNRLIEHAKNIRINVIKMVTNAASGHPGGSLSATDILTEIYFNQMDINKQNVDTLNRDRFVLSKGHASPALYATLAEKGFIDKAELLTFRKINSRIQGHPKKNPEIGVDMSTGSLGQGLSIALGMALANKLDKNDHRIYCIIGDGESQEGQIWEACMAAAHYKLDNLCAVLDFNHLQIDGNIEDVMNPTPYKEKFEAFNWAVLECDGHDFDQLHEAFEKAKTIKGKPTMIIAHTIKGKGVSFMENQASWHGSAPNEQQAQQAIEELEGK